MVETVTYQVPSVEKWRRIRTQICFAWAAGLRIALLLGKIMLRINLDFCTRYPTVHALKRGQELTRSSNSCCQFVWNSHARFLFTLIVKVDWKFLPFFSLDGRAIVLPLQEFFFRKCREFAESFKNLCSNKSIYRKKYIDRQFTTGEIMRPTRRRRSQACQTWFLLLLFTRPIVEFSLLLS